MMMNTYHYLVVVSLLYLSCHAVPLLPRWIDRQLPIPVEGLSWHEVTELILSPLLLCGVFALYRHLIVLRKKEASDLRYVLPFLIVACICQQGQGIHLAANTIHSTISSGNEYNPHASLTQRLTYFLDEHLGHHMIFAGLAFTFTLLIFHEKLYISRLPPNSPSSSTPFFLANPDPFIGYNSWYCMVYGRC